MNNEIEKLLDLWQRREGISGIYILPTSTSKNIDILLCLEDERLSYFERLDFYYPPSWRKDFLHVYPISRQEFKNWPEKIKEQVRKTIEKSRILWQKEPCW